MKVLFQSRESLLSAPSGDTTQVLKTKEYLEKMGVHIDISLELEPDASKYDIIHIFNFTRPQETFLQAKNAKKYHKKVALSPIFLDYSEYDKKGREGLARACFQLINKYKIEYCKIIGRAMVTRKMHQGTFLVLKKGVRKIQKETLRYIDLFLPNSQSEWNRFVKEFNISHSSCHVVPNAVDQHLFNAERVENVPEFKQFNGCVLCVARIDGRKNQFRLALALKDMPIKLVLVGKITAHHNKDFLKIKNLGLPNTYLLGNIPHEKLPALYAEAKIHALPSFFETTGLSSLEAAIMGCNIVVGDRGDVRDYFGDYAFYCEPDSVDSIRRAVLDAYHSASNPELKKHIQQNFTWEMTAKETFSAYQACFNN